MNKKTSIIHDIMNNPILNIEEKTILLKELSQELKDNNKNYLLNDSNISKTSIKQNAPREGIIEFETGKKVNIITRSFLDNKEYVLTRTLHTNDYIIYQLTKKNNDYIYTPIKDRETISKILPIFNKNLNNYKNFEEKKVKATIENELENNIINNSKIITNLEIIDKVPESHLIKPFEHKNIYKRNTNYYKHIQNSIIDLTDGNRIRVLNNCIYDNDEYILTKALYSNEYIVYKISELNGKKIFSKISDAHRLVNTLKLFKNKLLGYKTWEEKRTLQGIDNKLDFINNKQVFQNTRIKKAS